MDYYRHCFNFKDVQLNLLNTLADFGFVDKSTGDPVYDTLICTDKGLNSPNIKWKTLRWNNDLLADLNIGVAMQQSNVNSYCEPIQVWPSMYKTDGSYNSWYPTGSFESFSYIHQAMADYSVIGLTMCHENIVAQQDYYRQNIILIPLINGGFLYNFKYYPGPPTGPTHEKPIDPTPKLQIAGGSNTINTSYTGNRTLIGIPNTLKTNLNNYLYFGISGLRDPTYGNYVEYFLTDYQHTRTLNSIPYINTANTDYTDLNNNICTLIKMPYDNGYLDNVYMMATRPGELTKEGSFFSFAGRNFINVYKNLVLELPS